MPFDKPMRSSKFPAPTNEAEDGMSATDGDAIRCGVPAKPSRPDNPEAGDFWADAGAAPSKSISRRFSALACGGGAPETAAAAAAAARGFSRAFCNCSLLECKKDSSSNHQSKESNALNSSLLNSICAIPALTNKGLWRFVVDGSQG